MIGGIECVPSQPAWGTFAGSRYPGDISPPGTPREADPPWLQRGCPLPLPGPLPVDSQGEGQPCRVPGTPALPAGGVEK